MSTEPPRKLGKYELQERLGRGGMAEVWKALDTQLQRYVAIKLLHTNLQSDPNFVSRFQREAQVIASLHHPNIVQIHDFQVEQASPEADPIFYMVMAYIEGRTLADYIARTSAQGKIPSPLEVVNIFTSISLAVDYAHQKGMIHRDIKPANILLDQHNRARNPMGEPILTDFGLAKLLGVTAVTLTGTQLGTPLYTSPEQARGNPGNERSDLYSLGVILYEMVTGVAPFRGDTPTAVLAQHLFATPTSPVLLNPNIPPALTMVIMTALSKDPQARYSRAVTMAAAIAEALNVPVPDSLGQLSFVSDVRNMPTMGLGGVQTPLTPAGQPSNPGSLAGPASGAGGASLDASDATTQRSSLAGSATPQGGPVPAPVTPALWAANPPSWSGTMMAQQGSAPVPAVSGPVPVAHPSQAGGLQTPQGVSGQIAAVSPVRSGPPSGAIFSQGTLLQTTIPPQEQPPTIPPGRTRGRRCLFVLLSVLLLVAILGSGTGVYFAFFHRAAPAVSPGGQVFFVSSGQFNTGSAQGIADELEFSLHNLPAPQAGHAYYAWLLADKHPQAESVPLEPKPLFTLPLKIGPLPFSHGTINYLYAGTSAHDNLLSLASRLLITEESTGGQQQGPSANQNAWRYYAEIPQTPYGNPSLSALDHIRHLFYKETKVAVLGLPGGLDVWLFRNTETVLEEAISARDDYSATNVNVPLISGLFRNMLTYLDGSPNVGLDVPGGVGNADPASRVALLSVTPVQQQGTDLDNNPPGYVDHMALHLNGVAQAPDATPAMRALCTQMIEALNNAKAWLQQVRTYAKQLVGMNAAQLEQPSTLALLDNMLQYATFAYAGRLEPKSNQVVPGVVQVHYDVQRLATLTVSDNLPSSL
ncbi:MAG TPA: protein kinase [Ktedonobacteraceae bacterium]|nr:protein kinase [Ktedonobacteraceae bacterium]